MIVKNERDWLKQCLDSVVEIADEIIIVDTGSTDGTDEIGRDYHAAVYPFDWTESFADARNYGLERASGEWILWLDADETLELEDRSEFIQLLESDEKDLWLIPLVNYYGMLPPDPNRAYLFAGMRLFRNHRGFKFTGNIHEQLNALQAPGSRVPGMIPRARIHHYGYMDPVVESKKKYERNLSMLEKEMKQPDYDPWIDYHIACEYYRAKRYNDAFEQVNAAIMRFLQRNSLPPSLLYKLKYDILITLGSFDGAWPGIDNAIHLYPEYVDLHFYKGLILYKKEKPEQALAVFKHCLDLGEGSLRHLSLAGCGGYLAWFFIGKCFEAIENFSGAANAYSEALKLYPGYQEAWIELLNISNHFLN